VSAEKLMHSPPGTVFDFVAAHHFENHPRWDPDVLEMNQTSPGTVGVGTKANIVRRQGNRRVEGTATVTEYQPDQSAAWDVQFGPFLLRQRVELAPDQGGAATRLRLSIETRAKGLVRLIVPLLRSRFRKTMEQSLTRIASFSSDSPSDPDWRDDHESGLFGSAARVRSHSAAHISWLAICHCASG
jgi:polyketide cyclase/dehydrase/lipid transport protein